MYIARAMGLSLRCAKNSAITLIPCQRLEVGVYIAAKIAACLIVIISMVRSGGIFDQKLACRAFKQPQRLSQARTRSHKIIASLPVDGKRRVPPYAHHSRTGRVALRLMRFCCGHMSCRTRTVNLRPAVALSRVSCATTSVQRLSSEQRPMRPKTTGWPDEAGCSTVRLPTFEQDLSTITLSASRDLLLVFLAARQLKLPDEAVDNRFVVFRPTCLKSPAARRRIFWSPDHDGKEFSACPGDILSSTETHVVSRTRWSRSRCHWSTPTGFT